MFQTSLRRVLCRSSQFASEACQVGMLFLTCSFLTKHFLRFPRAPPSFSLKQCRYVHTVSHEKVHCESQMPSACCVFSHRWCQRSFRALCLGRCFQLPWLSMNAPRVAFQLCFHTYTCFPLDLPLPTLGLFFTSASLLCCLPLRAATKNTCLHGL